MGRNLPKVKELVFTYMPLRPLSGSYNHKQKDCFTAGSRSVK